MLNDILKWIMRTSLIAVFWVFVFSMSWDGRTLFYYANDVLVQNSIVRTLDEELAEIWDRIQETARVTFSTPSGDDEKV